MMEGGQYFTSKFVSVQNSFTWYLTGLYAPHTRGQKLRMLGRNRSNGGGSMDFPWEL